jgi:hypothetical protein
MPDIISAKCFGCGNVVRVPAALGGKKARCPKCTNTITIPTPADTSEEIVGDEELPEVARDEEVLQGDYIAEEGEAPFEENPHAPPPPPRAPVSRSTDRRRKGTSVTRGRTASGRPSQKGTSAQRLGRSGPGPGPEPKKQNPALVIGIIVGVIAVVGMGLVLAGGKGGKSGGGKPSSGRPEKPKTGPPTPEVPLIDDELRNRMVAYINACSKSDFTRALEFHSYAEGEAFAIKRGISKGVDEGRYEGASITQAKVDGDSGTVVYDSKGGSNLTVNWRRVGGAWMIVDKPN